MWVNLVLKFLPLLIQNITPELRKLLVDMIMQLEQKAQATTNPYDDAAVLLLKAAFSIR